MNKYLLALIILSLMLAIPVNANDFQEGAGAHDSKTAFAKMKTLAEQGDAPAQASLGFKYNYGVGVSQDYKEAVRWYRMSAKQGNASAQNNLGGAYFRGEGVVQDYKEAVKFYRLAAKQGNALAQSNLGFMYDMGKGVPQDNIQAHKWYSIGTVNGEELAGKNRDDIEINMTPDQIAEAQKSAMEWMRQHRGKN